MATWFRKHVWAILICTLLFLVGISLGAGVGGTDSSATATSTITVNGSATTLPAETVTQTETETESATSSEPASSSSGGGSSGGGVGAPKPKTYTGEGGQRIVVFVRRPGYVRWTNTGDLFTMSDPNFDIVVNSQAKSGKTYVGSPGKYVLDVNAIGSWTITVP